MQYIKSQNIPTNVLQNFVALDFLFLKSFVLIFALHKYSRAIVQRIMLSPMFLVTSGVSGWSHSVKPHLQRTKGGLMGVHSTKLHSKDTRQKGQTGSQLPAACFASKTSSLPLSACILCLTCSSN